jgi:AcrR family transcriptional regulator
MYVSDGSLPRDSGEPESTREALLYAADDLFATRGYNAVSTSDIVRRAEVTRGALYHHFRDKEQLFLHVFERVEQDVVDSIAGRLAKVDDPWELLVEGLRAFLDACADTRVLRVAFRDAPAVLGVERWREVSDRHGFQLLLGNLTRAIDAGVIAAHDPTSLGHLLHGSLVEAALLIARAEDREEGRRQAEEPLMELLVGLHRQAL